MKLYWGPHTCAIGIHILLEETGSRYETVQVDVAGGATEQAAFLAINPKGKVPTLVRDDGSVLTEFGAIATWLARSFPQAQLLPASIESQTRVMEVMEYVEGTIHGQGFGRMFKPERFEQEELLRSRTEQQGKQIVEKAFEIVDHQLAGRPFVAGNTFSIADAALFYVERWSPQQGIHLTKNLQAHFERLLARPSVKKVRELWGEA